MKPFLPLLIWLALLPLAGWEFILHQWEGLLVLFAALVLIPMGLALIHIAPGKWYPAMVAGLCAAYLLDTPGTGFPDALALPYLLWPVWLTLREATELWAMDKIRLPDVVRVFALGYWATGAFWAVCFLAGFRPIGFDPVIVALTAAHFHVAGFVLAVVAERLIRENPNIINRFSGWGVLAGMPLVATGITLSKLGYPTWIESVSAIGFVSLALVVVVQHIRLFMDKRYSKVVRWYWLAGSVCLLAGGLFAAVYALRFRFPLDFFNIPHMKIWHGTLNAVGFGWLVLRGWGINDK